MKVQLKLLHKDLATILLVGRVRRVYAELGKKMVSVLESTSGLLFTSGVVIRAGYSEDNAWEGSAGYNGQKAISLLFPKNSRVDLGFDDLAVWLMMHELGHRLLEQHGFKHRYVVGEDMEQWHEAEHRLLFLFLIDALGLLGEQGQRIIHRFPTTGYTNSSYGNTRAWRWAKAFTIKERRELWIQIIKTRDLDLLSMQK